MLRKFRVDDSDAMLIDTDLKQQALSIQVTEILK